MYCNSIIEAIGGTPLLRLNNIEQAENAGAAIFAKVEGMNPGGSIKDRAALYMIRDAEAKGLLKPGGTIIEPTSGNTGIGLALIAAVMGYKAIMVMPSSMSIERVKLLKAYGAEVVLTEASKGMQGTLDKVKELSKEIQGSFVAGQFDNKANAKAHYEMTGPEIWKSLDGKVDAVVAAFGTGGTISGIGKFLKEKNPEIEVVTVEPAKSPLLSKGKFGPHNLQGIGANFIPKVLDEKVIDRIITVDEEDAYKMSRDLASKEGCLSGITSGANLYAAICLSKEEKFKGKNIVVILPDSGERYLSTALFNE